MLIGFGLRLLALAFHHYSIVLMLPRDLLVGQRSWLAVLILVTGYLWPYVALPIALY